MELRPASCSYLTKYLQNHQDFLRDVWVDCPVVERDTAGLTLIVCGMALMTLEEILSSWLFLGSCSWKWRKTGHDSHKLEIQPGYPPWEGTCPHEDALEASRLRKITRESMGRSSHKDNRERSTKRSPGHMCSRTRVRAGKGRTLA